MISANARLYEYVMPFGIVCSPPVYQFTNLPIYTRMVIIVILYGVYSQSILVVGNV